MELWSTARHAGVLDEEFWRSSPEEVEAVIERRYEAERAATLRAGLIASTLINVNRKKGAKLVTPQDFIKEPRKEEDYMSPREAAAFMDKWAAGVNRGAKKKSKKRGAEG